MVWRLEKEIYLIIVDSLQEGADSHSGVLLHVIMQVATCQER